MNNASISAHVNDMNNAHNFVAKYPTLTAQRRALAKAAGEGQRFVSAETVTDRIGAVIYHAGEVFLNDIHNEIDAAKPEWMKHIDEDEADEEARHEDKKNISIAINGR